MRRERECEGERGVRRGSVRRECEEGRESVRREGV